MSVAPDQSLPPEAPQPSAEVQHGAAAPLVDDDALAAALDCFAHAMLALRPDGALVHANQAALELLQQNWPFELTPDHRLQPQQPSWRVLFALALQQAAAGQPQPIHWVEGRPDAEPVDEAAQAQQAGDPGAPLDAGEAPAPLEAGAEASADPPADPSEEAGGRQRSVHAVLRPLGEPGKPGSLRPVLMLVSPGPDTVYDVSGFAAAYRLSRAETRVLEALMHGDQAEDAAQRLGVGLATVRSQIAAIRKKAGFASVSSLLAALGSLPALRRPRPKGDGSR